MPTQFYNPLTVPHSQLDLGINFRSGGLYGVAEKLAAGGEVCVSRTCFAITTNFSATSWRALLFRPGRQLAQLVVVAVELLSKESCPHQSTGTNDRLTSLVVLILYQLKKL